jgi:hypothetical protein
MRASAGFIAMIDRWRARQPVQDIAHFSARRIALNNNVSVAVALRPFSIAV